jgi:N-methylhydantoinase B/oxoprolinase/acetone carboxylase alpha subunit
MVVIQHLRAARYAGTASIDFSGTDPELYGNLNAPKAVVYSAIIYVMRCLVRHDIPLNQVRLRHQSLLCVIFHGGLVLELKATTWRTLEPSVLMSLRTYFKNDQAR